MADELKPAEPVARVRGDGALTPPVKPDNGVLGKRGETMLAFLAALLFVAVLALGWRAFVYQEEGDPVASAMLAFEKQNSLTVFSSRFEVVAESIDTRTVFNIDVLETRQAAIIPASVEYRLDLSGINASDMEWDAGSETLQVTLPQLQTSRPNLDEAQARIFTEGVWVTRDASNALAKNNSQQAERKAQAFAKNPEILALARTAAKDAVRQNLAVPLQVAGFENARVKVGFEGEN